MARSTPSVVRVVRVSFESTRLSPQCLAETYARIVPITRRAVGASTKAAPVAAARLTTTRRAEHD
jgi:hypothetical protein